MTKCPICNTKYLKYIKTINKINIDECRKCSIAIIPRNIAFKPKDIYDFKNYEKNRSKYIKRYKELVDLIYTHKKEGAILDVGAGFGLISSLLNKKSNYNIELLEPYLPIKYIRNLQIHKTTLQEFLARNNKKFDIVLLIDVLEHFSNPKKILISLSKILKKNGLIVIQTPNYKSLMARITKYWAWWMIEDHKVIFSVKSLTKLLHKTSYNILYRKTYEELYDFKKNLDGNFSNLTNNIFRKIIKGFFYTFFCFFYLTLRKFIWKKNLGGLIFMIVQKQ